MAMPSYLAYSPGFLLILIIIYFKHTDQMDLSNCSDSTGVSTRRLSLHCMSDQQPSTFLSFFIPSSGFLLINITILIRVWCGRVFWRRPRWLGRSWCLSCPYCKLAVCRAIWWYAESYLHLKLPKILSAYWSQNNRNFNTTKTFNNMWIFIISKYLLPNLIENKFLYFNYLWQ